MRKTQKRKTLLHLMRKSIHLPRSYNRLYGKLKRTLKSNYNQIQIPHCQNEALHPQYELSKLAFNVAGLYQTLFYLHFSVYERSK